MSNEITGLYRDWFLTITDPSTSSGRATVTGIRLDNSQERFECHLPPDMERVLRFARRKIDDLEGPEVWIEGYEREALD